ncbi:RNA polymerase sigma factor [Parasegetibacter sp. NRK P23]|uniref:RNA polymerase sigma factor n=1 Tax=Parasegetibacter sp. NRK P23 TaxID=2942999 RepID=UPI002043974B|nr:RNA polymerase sigma factor [Parasegetibacter sp. NRK P23]MCM5528081.1 RNA polymerase sigma factor [Parasegetibacter sp. NRK P23]
MTSINSNNMEERRIWEAFAHGDDGALKTLYDAYFETLFSFGRKFTGNTSLAEDGIQDLFLKLMNNRAALAVPDHVSAYLIRAYRNILIDKQRKIQSTRTDQLDGSEFPGAFSLETALEEKEELMLLREKLKKALEDLTPRQREIIYLRYHYNFSYEETAEILGLTEKATYKLMARAIQGLKDAFPLLLLFLK